MKTNLNALMGGTALLCTGIVLSACGGGGGGAPYDPTAQVPISASTSAEAATQYTADLSATSPDATDTLEPVAVPTALATDDMAEPAPI